MRFSLVIGNKNYSSWSMRAWLLMRFVEAPFHETVVQLYRDDSRTTVRGIGGETGLVPVLIDSSTPIWDTLAISETLYETYPRVWPSDPMRRARARSYSGEVHSSFNALRNAMPVNTRGRNRRATIDDAVRADIARINSIWATAGGYPDGPWLLGEFCAADIMFAPVASRFQTYGIAPAPEAAPYFERILSHPLVTEWFAMRAAEQEAIPMLELPEGEL